MAFEKKTWMKVDNQSVIDKCLNCVKPECTNCLGSSYKREVRSPRFTEKALAALRAYPFHDTDKSVGDAIGASVSYVQVIREKFKLPVAKSVSVEERTTLVNNILEANNYGRV